MFHCFFKSYGIPHNQSCPDYHNLKKNRVSFYEIVKLLVSTFKISNFVISVSSVVGMVQFGVTNMMQKILIRCFVTGPVVQYPG